MQLHQYQYLCEPYSYDTPLIHIGVVELKLTLRAHVEMEVVESVDDGIREGRPLRAALLCIYV